MKIGTRDISSIFLIIFISTLTTSLHSKSLSRSTLEIYSYYTSNPPRINGDITDGTNQKGSTVAGTNNDEWKDAYTRTIPLTDGNDITIFIMNTADSLYIGFSYAHGNNGGPNGIAMYFDQGPSGGSHDNVLTGPNNENAVFSNRSTQGDSTWNGTAWISDDINFNVAEEYFTNVFHWEFAIPLNNGLTGDLSVDSTDELGFLFAIIKNGGGGGVYYWDSTNSNPLDASSWANLKLGVVKKFTTFYASHNANGNPTVTDGMIKGGTDYFKDDAWRGSYMRNILLTNFAGSSIHAVFYGIDDAANNKFYVGLKIEDSDNNTSDYLRFYQEQHATTPTSTRDYVLNDNGENMVEADANAFDGDYFWDADIPSWTNTGDDIDQNGKGTFYTNHYEYEFELGYALGALDLQLNDGAAIGFLIQYHDADQPVGKQDYFWEYTTNRNAVLLNETATPDVYGAIGWGTMQLGAPYVQVIFPEENKEVEGVANIRIYAEDENINGITSAIFYRTETPSVTYNLTRINSTNEWSGTWDVTGLPAGADTIVIEVTDDDNITVERIVNVTIRKDTNTVILPSVNITAPQAGEVINGIINVLFTTSLEPPAAITKCEASIDGGEWTDSLVDTSSYSMTTVGWTDGTHSVRIRCIDQDGNIGYSKQRIFIVDNSPPIIADPRVIYPNNSGITKNDSTILISVFIKDLIIGLATDSPVVLTGNVLVNDSTQIYLMHDNGSGGDLVAGDHIFSSNVKINSDTTGDVSFSIIAKDKLGNSDTITSKIMLDNTIPVIAEFKLIPEPDIVSSITGKRIYNEKLIFQGKYTDAGGSGISRATIHVLNDSSKNVNNSPIELSVKDSMFSRIIWLVPGVNYLTLIIKDNSGNEVSKSDTINYTLPKITKVIDRSGGTVQSPDGASVSIPANALLTQHEITIKRVLEVNQPKPLNTNHTLLHVAHEFGPHDLQFRKPATLTLPYTEADIDKNQDGIADIDAEKLIIVFWDGYSWLKAGKTSIDTVNQLVSVSINHFSMFDIAQDNSGPISKLRTYWTKNPIPSNSGSFFNYSLPSDGIVSLFIMDLSGDLVYELIPKNTPLNAGDYSIGWNGQNVANKFTGAGIYIYNFVYINISDNSKTIIKKPIALLKK